MRIIITTIALLFLLSSCATTLTKRTHKLKVESNTKGDRIEVDNTIHALPAEIKVRKSKADLQLKLLSDSTVTRFRVRSSPNPAFAFGNLLWMQVAPAAYLIDLTNPKRFYYGKSVYLNTADTVRTITPRVRRIFVKYFTKNFVPQKGQVNVSLTLPSINNFSLRPPGENRKSNTGFLGLSAGIDYFYKNHTYLNLSATGVLDFLVPVPVPVDFSGEHEAMASAFVSLTNNHRAHRFHFGYGFSFSRNVWNLQYYDQFNPPPPAREPVRRVWESAGLLFNTYHQFTRNFQLGILYRPTFYRTTPASGFVYEHLISFDIAWRFKLIAPRP